MPTRRSSGRNVKNVVRNATETLDLEQEEPEEETPSTSTPKSARGKTGRKSAVVENPEKYYEYRGKTNDWFMLESDVRRRIIRYLKLSQLKELNCIVCERPYTTAEGLLYHDANTHSVMGVVPKREPKRERLSITGIVKKEKIDQSTVAITVTQRGRRSKQTTFFGEDGEGGGGLSDGGDAAGEDVDEEYVEMQSGEESVDENDVDVDLIDDTEMDVDVGISPKRKSQKRKSKQSQPESRLEEDADLSITVGVPRLPMYSHCQKRRADNNVKQTDYAHATSAETAAYLAAQPLCASFWSSVPTSSTQCITSLAEFVSEHAAIMFGLAVQSCPVIAEESGAQIARADLCRGLEYAYADASIGYTGGLVLSILPLPSLDGSSEAFDYSETFLVSVGPQAEENLCNTKHACLQLWSLHCCTAELDRARFECLGVARFTEETGPCWSLSMRGQLHHQGRLATGQKWTGDVIVAAGCTTGGCVMLFKMPSLDKWRDSYIEIEPLCKLDPQNESIHAPSILCWSDFAPQSALLIGYSSGHVSHYSLDSAAPSATSVFTVVYSEHSVKTVAFTMGDNESADDEDERRVLMLDETGTINWLDCRTGGILTTYKADPLHNAFAFPPPFQQVLMPTIENILFYTHRSFQKFSSTLLCNLLASSIVDVEPAFRLMACPTVPWGYAVDTSSGVLYTTHNDGTLIARLQNWNEAFAPYGNKLLLQTQVQHQCKDVKQLAKLSNCREANCTLKILRNCKANNIPQSNSMSTDTRILEECLPFAALFCSTLQPNSRRLHEAALVCGGEQGLLLGVMVDRRTGSVVYRD